MPKIRTDQWRMHPGGPHPVSGQDDGPSADIALGDAIGLTQFGARLEKLPPGSRSSHRHWHEGEDELICVLSGALVLVEEDETPLGSGDVAGWKAGVPVGHCLENRSDQEAVFLVVGKRLAADVVHYPDHDVVLRHDTDGRRYLRTDRTPISPEG